MAKEWSVKLNTGATMPAFGLGTWLSKPEEMSVAVEAALKAGYRLLDCAHFYGNEVEIGETLQKCFREGVCKREDLFITSKLWSDSLDQEYVLPSVELTLKNLQIDYLDLYLIHVPFAFRRGTNFNSVQEEDKYGYVEEKIATAWKVMEGLVAKGLTRAIGVSNFSILKTENLMKTAKIVPAVNQVECHAYFQEKKLREYCDSKGITIEAFAPLGSPGRWTIKEDVPVLLEDPVVNEIATEKGVTAAQICISFLLHRGFVVIPKSVTPKRILENYKATEVSLSEEDIQRLVGIDKNYRLFIELQTFLPKGVMLEDALDVEADEKFVIEKK